MLNDTNPRAERILVEGFRAMSPARKMELLDQMTLAAQELSLAGLRLRHPDADERTLELMLASLRLDRETMVRVFGWDPAEHGR